MDFGVLSFGQIESLLASLQGFNLGNMAATMVLTGTAHSVTPPGLELASARTTTAIQAQVAQMDGICMASGANVMAFLSVSQANKAGAMATDLATAAPFAAL